jgi:hypothetical protein
VNTYNGAAGSLEVIIPFSTTTQQMQIGPQFASPGVSISAGSTITMWVRASNNGNAMQLFDQSGSGDAWDGGGWVNATSGYAANTWFQVSYTVSPSQPTSVMQFGLQVPSGTAAGQSNGLPVTIWIDGVTITAPAPTATSTYTPLITNTPTVTCSTTTTPALIDDMEANSPSDQIIVQQCRGGYWYSSNDGTAGGVQALTITGPGTGSGCVGSSTYAMSVTANAGFTSWGDNFGFNLTQPAGPYNASQYTGIEFCAMSNTGTPSVGFGVKDANSVAANSGPHTVYITLTNSWALYQATFATLENLTVGANGGNSYGTATTFVPAQIETLQWSPPSATAYNILIDNVSFY